MPKRDRRSMEMSVRKKSVVGTFYPNDKKQIEKMIEDYNTVIDTHLKQKEVLKLKPSAIIVPHAGYIYSAFTANLAFRLLANSNPKRIVVIGPSHRIYLDGVSASFYDEYDTPFRKLKIDKEFIKELEKNFEVKFIPEAHQEHSTEVQMPLIARYFGDIEIVELVYGKEDPKHLSKIIDFCLNQKDTAVVISTDLSHYYNINEAKKLDSICMKAIVELDETILHKGCEACGKIGVEAMILEAKRKKLTPRLLDYRTSADASGDEKRVVGYLSVAFI